MSKAGFVSSITRQSEDFPGWYNDVVLKAELADYSPVRGCMIIRPYGYAIWESMRDELDRHIKRTGHSNVYFPLFVPKSLLEKEAEHVEGFNPQVAWVTHAGGKELDEPLAIRPTSEAIIADVVKDWIQSYRDLPLLMNLWNNVVRWELRTRLFLRTTEFLWQEAHTFHATEEEAADEVATGLEALPRGGRGLAGHPGHPGPQEPRGDVPGRHLHARHRGHDARPQGAPGGHQPHARPELREGRGHRVPRPRQPAQAPLGHVLGLLDAHGGRHDHGPRRRLGPGPAAQRRARPSWSSCPSSASEEDRVAVAGAIERLEASLADVQTAPGRCAYKVDWREESPGFKFNHWELRGVPLRLEIGPRDVAAGQAVIVRRLDRAKETLPLDALAAELPGRLAAYQAAVFQRALDFRAEQHPRRRHLGRLQGESLDGPGGFLMAPWCGSAECEKPINADTGATIRVIPFDSPDEPGACIVDGRPSERRVLFARAY